MLNRYIYCLFFLFSVSGSISAIDNKHKAVSDSIRSVRDSIAKNDIEVLETKPIGRYDRGIMNYRFIPKGYKMFGLTASYTSYDSKDSKFMGFLTNMNYHGKRARVNPFAGYFFKDNQMLGVKLGYSHIIAQLDNIELPIDDIDFSLADLRLSESLYSGIIFHRSYVGLDAGKRFGLFNEVNLSYTSGSSTFSRIKENAPVVTETTITELQLGLNPGVSIFIMQNVAAELSIGVAGITYRNQKQTVNQVDAGTFRNSGANFKINLLNINIGVTVCL